MVFATAGGGAIFALTVWLMEFSPGMPWRALVALLPMLALALFLWAFVGCIRCTDERIQRVELLAVSIAAISVPSLWYGLGLLHSAEVIGVSPGFALFWVWPMMFLAYGAAKLVLMLRDVWAR